MILRDRAAKRRHRRHRSHPQLAPMHELLFATLEHYLGHLPPATAALSIRLYQTEPIYIPADV